MQDTAILASCATHVLEGSQSPRPQGPNPQLSLPSGPTHILKGRPRTDPDDVWLDAMRVQALQHLDPTKPSASDRTDEDVLRVVAWAASCNNERACWASIAGLQVKLRGMSRSTVQRSLSRWAARGVFEFLHRKGGRPSQSARGRFNLLILKLKDERVNPVKMTERSKRSKNQDLPEPRSHLGRPLPICDAGGQIQQEPSEGPGLHPTVTRPPEKARPPDNGKRVLRFWYGLQRKLGGWGQEYIQSQGRIFNALPHVQKVQVINQLLSEERRGVESGSLVAFQAGGRQ